MWERLISEERLRNTISREHCEVKVMGTSSFTLRNLSTIGTVLNGVVVKTEAPLKFDDIIGLGHRGAVGADVKPVLHFRLVAGAAQVGGGGEVVAHSWLADHCVFATCDADVVSGRGRICQSAK